MGLKYDYDDIDDKTRAFFEWMDERFDEYERVRARAGLMARQLGDLFGYLTGYMEGYLESSCSYSVDQEDRSLCLAMVLLAVLEAHGYVVSERVREQILGVSDLDDAIPFITRAARFGTLDEPGS